MNKNSGYRISILQDTMLYGFAFGVHIPINDDSFVSIVSFSSGCSSLIIGFLFVPRDHSPCKKTPVFIVSIWRRAKSPVLLFLSSASASVIREDSKRRLFAPSHVSLCLSSGDRGVGMFSNANFIFSTHSFLAL